MGHTMNSFSTISNDEYIEKGVGHTMNSFSTVSENFVKQLRTLEGGAGGTRCCQRKSTVITHV